MHPGSCIWTVTWQGNNRAVQFLDPHEGMVTGYRQEAGCHGVMSMPSSSDMGCRRKTRQWAYAKTAERKVMAGEPRHVEEWEEKEKAEGP